MTALKELWEYDKNYFSPKMILETTDSILREIIQKYLSPRYINEAVLRWKVNSQKLIDEYDSKPIDIFQVSKDALKVEKAIRVSRGFGPKTGIFSSEQW